MDVFVFDTIAKYCDVPSMVMLALTCRVAEKAVVQQNLSSPRFVAVSAIHNATLKRCLYIISDYVGYHPNVLFVDSLFISQCGYAYHSTERIMIINSKPVFYQPLMVPFEELICSKKTRRIIIWHFSVGFVNVGMVTEDGIMWMMIKGKVILPLVRR